MQYLIETYKKTGALHHAYLIEGEREVVAPRLIAFFEKILGIPARGNPDVCTHECDTFGIDDARALKEQASKKAVRGGLQLFVVIFNNITHEAQNALLKLFEEPTPNTHFFVVTQNTAALLPTLLSRFMEVPLKNREGPTSAIAEVGPSREDKAALLAEKFLKAKKAIRMKLLKDIIENKDKAKAAAFLRDLEKALYENTDLKTADKNIQFAFKEIRKCRQYVNDRAPSVKMLLEHVALITPVVQ